MFYNPYNWKIEKDGTRTKVDVKMDVFPGKMVCKKKCLLNELTETSFERDCINFDVTKTLEEIKDLQAQIKEKEAILEKLLVKMSKKDEKIIEISHQLPIFEK